MEERTIVAVTPIEETDWGEPQCMSATLAGAAACDESADKELALEYDDEPDKTFYTCLCESCAADYCKQWDEAQIFGDEALYRNPHRVK